MESLIRQIGLNLALLVFSGGATVVALNNPEFAKGPYKDLAIAFVSGFMGYLAPRSFSTNSEKNM